MTRALGRVARSWPGSGRADEISKMQIAGRNQRATASLSCAFLDTSERE